MEAWKENLLNKAIKEGIIKDPHDWLTRLDEPMPIWAVLELAIQLIERLDPPYKSYD